LFDVIALYLLLASVFPLSRVGVTTAQPIFFTGVRMVLSGIVLVFYCYLRDSRSFKQFVNLKYIGFWLILAVFNIYLTNVLEFWGLQTLTAAKACFIYNLSPFFAALFSYLIFGERMTTKKWLGLVIGFVGCLPILLHNTKAEDLIGGVSFFSWPELALLGAAIATAFGWIIMRNYIQKVSYPPILANGMSMLIASVMIFPTSVLLEQWNPVPIYHYQQFFIYVILISFISNIIGYNFYGILLKKYTATFLSFAGIMSPLFAAAMGWAFLNEAVSWQFFVSTIAVFVGLFIFYQEELRLGYIARR